MTQSLFVLFFIFAISQQGCGLPQESKDAQQSGQNKASPTLKNEITETTIDNVDKKVIEQLLEDAKAYLREEELSAAERIISDGLKKTEGISGLETAAAHFMLLRGKSAMYGDNEIEARRHFADALAVFHVQKNDDGRFETFVAVGCLETRRGDYPAAERQFEQAETIKGNVKNSILIGHYSMEKGRLASRKMKSDDAIKLYQEAFSVFETAKDKQAVADVLVLLANEEYSTDKLSAARKGMEKAAALYSEIKDDKERAYALHRLAIYAEREQQPAKAIRLYKEALNLYEQQGKKSNAAAVGRRISYLTIHEEEQKKN